VAILESAQKLRGGYYTPKLVADFLAQWALRHAETVALEPSCGDGNISVAAAERLFALGARPREVARQLTSVELDFEEAEKATQRLRAMDVGITESPVINSDFFRIVRTYCSAARGSMQSLAIHRSSATTILMSDIGNPRFRLCGMPVSGRRT